MDGELHFREGLPWLLAAVALVVAFFAVSILAPGDESDPEGLALVVIVTALWSVALVGLGLAVKGFLVIPRDVHRGHAWLVAGAALISAVIRALHPGGGSHGRMATPHI